MVKKKNIKQRIVIFFLIIFLFALSGFIFNSNVEKEEYFKVKYSIKLNQNTFAILDTIDGLMRDMGVEKFKGKKFRKTLEVDFYLKNTNVYEKFDEIQIIGLATDSILFETNSNDNLDERFDRLITNLNDEIWLKLSENISIYKKISEKIIEQKNEFFYNQLIDLKNFKLDNNLLERMDELKVSNKKTEEFTNDISILSKLIQYFVNEASHGIIPSDSVYEKIVNDLNVKISIDNLEYLILKFQNKKVQSDFRFLSLNSFIEELEKHKNFIIPIKQTKIEKDSPNKSLILLLFTLFGIFFAMIYFVLSSKNLKLLMKKKLEL